MPAEKHANRLIHEKSPYLLQHAYNPVDWYPWCEEAFERARREDKPVFLSIGYSTCHWCHVMARESFEDAAVAERMNRDFISVKVDREERPDIDGVYMRACQTMTGGGGWPTSVFLDGSGNPFYAGTYYPKDAFLQILKAAANAWKQNRETLEQTGARLAAAMEEDLSGKGSAAETPVDAAVSAFRQSFDPEYGGFGHAPKFPTPHNLLFLLRTAPELAERTLECMYRGGIFDHVGGGFSRYSTDRFWLIPHFEKMLYDNALLAMAYLSAYELTARPLYRTVAERIFEYLDRDLRASDGGYYAAQDADSDGGEGRFYVFFPKEVADALGKADGARFCDRYGITADGNFEGKSVPNLLSSPVEEDRGTDCLTSKIYEYRRRRTAPHTDTKKLTAWNALTAAAFAMGARILKDERYLNAARDTLTFIEKDLTEGDAVYSGSAGGKRSGPGFLDDYAFYAFALLQMHQASLDDAYLLRAKKITEQAIHLFGDREHAGFFFSGENNEKLIARPKESWDGALPSGNSVMAYNLSRLSLLLDEPELDAAAEKQRRFMNSESAYYPMGYSFFLWSALPVKKIICVPAEKADTQALSIHSDWVFRVTNAPDYPLINNKTTYYICEQGRCLPPVNEL